jgi:hypothetical protein
MSKQWWIPGIFGALALAVAAMPQPANANAHTYELVQFEHSFPISRG